MIPTLFSLLRNRMEFHILKELVVMWIQVRVLNSIHCVVLILTLGIFEYDFYSCNMQSIVSVTLYYFKVFFSLLEFMVPKTFWFTVSFTEINSFTSSFFELSLPTETCSFVCTRCGKHSREVDVYFLSSFTCVSELKT